MLALRFGQLSPFMLAGLVGFLWCVRRERDFAAGRLAVVDRGQAAAGGAGVGALRAVGAGRSPVEGELAGAATCIVIGSAAALATNPRVFAQYVALMSSAPPTLTFESPNIATVLRVFSHTKGKPGRSTFRRRWVPLAWRGLVVPAADDVGRRRHLPGLVILACLLTSYDGDGPSISWSCWCQSSRWPRSSAGPSADRWCWPAARCLWQCPRCRSSCTPGACLRWRSRMTPAVAITWWAMRPSLPDSPA